MMILNRNLEQQEWIDRVYSIVVVKCDFCGEDMEVASDSEPNENGLWKCGKCIVEETHAW